MTKAVEILAREHDERDGAYEKALWLIDKLARGEIAPGRVSVDLQARTYTWLSEEEWQARQAERRPRESSADLADYLPRDVKANNERLEAALAARNGHTSVGGPLRVEGGVEGLRKLAEEAEQDSGGEEKTD